MKNLFRLVLLCVFSGLPHGVVAAQLVLFTFEGAAGNEETFGAESHAEPMVVGEMVRGGGLSLSSGAGAFSAKSWSTGDWDSEDYFSFSVRPASGYQFNLTGVEFDERRSGSGVQEWTVRSSLDGFAGDLPPGPVTVPDDTEYRRDHRLTFDGESYSSLHSELELRIYGYRATSSAGTWRIDNVELFGSVTAVPEPASWGAGLGMGLLAVGLAFRRRRSDRLRVWKSG